MKKWFPFYLLCVALFMVSCSKNEYVNTLPKETKMVLAVNIADLSQKAGLGNQAVQTELRHLLAQSNDTAHASLIQGILDNPANCGFDLQKRMFFYMTEQDMGMVAAVDDADKMTAFFQKLEKLKEVNEVEEVGDYTWVVGSNLLMAYNDERFLAINFYGDDGVFRQKMKRLLEQDNEASFTATESYKKFDDVKGDIALFASYGVLPSDFVKKWKSMLPAELEVEDLECILSFNFEKGRAIATVELFSEYPEAQKQIKQITSQMKRLNGLYGECVPADFSLFATFHCTKGMIDAMLKNNKELGLLLTLLNQSLPITDMLRSINGDIAVCTLPMQGSETPMIAYAHLDNQDFMKGASSWSRDCASMGLSLIETSARNFVVGSRPNLYYFGVKNDYLYYSNKDELAKTAGETYRNKIIQPWLGGLKDSYGFALVNIPNLIQMGDTQTGVRFLPVSLFSQLDVLVLRVVEPTKIEMILTTKNQNENLLKSMLQSCLK